MVKYFGVMMRIHHTGYSKEEHRKTPVQIGRTVDIDDEQLDIMVSSL
jgi:hypothetical protein